MLNRCRSVQVLAFYFRQLAEIESSLATSSEKVQRTLESMTGEEDYTPEEKVSWLYPIQIWLALLFLGKSLYRI